MLICKHGLKLLSRLRAARPERANPLRIAVLLSRLRAARKGFQWRVLGAFSFKPPTGGEARSRSIGITKISFKPPTGGEARKSCPLVPFPPFKPPTGGEEKSMGC